MKYVKLILLLAIITYFNQVVTAQIVTKSAINVGGNFGLSVTQSKGSDAITIFSMDPRFGYFVADNFSIGAELPVSVVKGFNSIGMGVILRYISNLGVFGELSGGFSSNKFESFARSTGGYVNMGVGYAAFINETVAIEPQFYYRPQFSGGSTVHNYGLKVGFNIYLKNFGSPR